MEKVILHFEEAQYISRLREIEKTKSMFETLHSEVTKLDLFKISSITDLIELVNAEDKVFYCKQRIAAKLGTPQIGAFKQDPMKVVETLDLPDFQPMIKAAIDCYSDYLTASKYLSIEDGFLVFSSQDQQKLKDFYTMYADTPSKLKVLDAYKKFIAGVAEFNEVLGSELGQRIWKDTHFGKFVNVSNDFSILPKTDFFSTHRNYLK